ncbi:cytochrome P450 [Xylariaceae sp. AK1471]|nr:cytochrome P450 [Xylariaceae sp. AK1471]
MGSLTIGAIPQGSTMELSFLPLSTSVVVFLYLILLVTYRLCLHPLSQFPGPRLAAATAWYEAFFDLVPPGGRFMHKLNELHEIYGPIVRINPHEIHIKDSSWAEKLYTGPSHGIRDKYPPAAHMTGTPDGVFGTVPHSIHRKRRAAVSPLFSKVSVAASETTIYENVDRMLASILRQISSNGYAEMRMNFLAFSTDTLAEHAFGETLDLLRNEDKAKNWQNTIKAVAYLTPIVKQFPWVIPVALKLPVRPLELIVPDLARIVRLRRDMDLQAQEAIKSHAACRNGQYLDQDARQPINGTPRLYQTILSNKALPRSEKSFDRMAQEAFVTIVAGGETTGRVLTTATYYILASQIDVLPRLKKELIEVMPQATTQVPVHVLEGLPYLTAIIKESLRITALVTSRLPLISPQECLIFREWVIPPGIPISMTLRDILLDPDVFDDPLTFRPERWLSSNPKLTEITRNYLPFGRGSRSCLGINLALAEMYIVIACMFRRFNFDLHETIKERDIDTVRDCFIAEVSPDTKGVRIKYASGDW